MNDIVSALQPVGGRLLTSASTDYGYVESVTIDSRATTPGALFVPIVADRDGHDFIASAVAAGAVATLVAVDRAEELAGTGGTPALADPEGGPVAVIAVRDTAAALLELGKAARNRLRCEVVGVTGSVGKTSVKDLLSAIGSVHGSAHANQASFNNELGVPLTLLSSPVDADLVVIEMGARDLGHIDLLCSVARPTIGVVTAVAAVHTEIFGSIDQVAQAKGELVTALPASGAAILNADDPLVASMASRSGADRVITFGSGSADVGISEVEVGLDLHPTFTLTTPVGSGRIRLGVAGAHMAMNAAAAAAAAIAAGIPFSAVEEGLISPTMSPLRMEVLRTASGATIINDSYNANPTSMRAAIEALVSVRADRRRAVLGVMAELGPGEEEDHRAIAQFALDRGVDVIAVDAPLYGSNAIHCSDFRTAVERLGSLSDGDAVLVKGSRVAALERVVDAVLELNQ